MTTQTEDSSVCSIYSVHPLQPGMTISAADFPPVASTEVQADMLLAWIQHASTVINLLRTVPWNR